MGLVLETTDDYILFSKTVSISTFLLGSILLFLYYITHYHGVIYLSLLFMTAAFLVNFILSLILIYHFLKYKKQKKRIFISLIIICLNIPIGLFYIKYGFEIYDLIILKNG